MFHRDGEVDKINIKFSFNFMKTVTLLDRRTRSKALVKRLERGKRLRLARQRRPLAALGPVRPVVRGSKDDSFRNLCSLAEPGLPPLTNEEIDQTLYGEPQDLR